MIADGAGEKIESISVEQRILKDLDAPFVKPLTTSPALKHLVVPEINLVTGFLILEGDALSGLAKVKSPAKKSPGFFSGLSRFWEK